jgi:hypothetical protein
MTGRVFHAYWGGGKEHSFRGRAFGDHRISQLQEECERKIKIFKSFDPID